MSLLNSWSTLTPPPLPPRGRFSSSSQSPPQKMALTAAVLVLDCLFFSHEIITKEGSLYTLDACCFNCFVWYFADIGVYTTTDTNGNWGRYHPAAEGVWHKLEVEQGLYGGNQVILTFQMSCVISNSLFQYHLVIKLNEVVIKEIYQSDARNWNTRFFASFGPGDPPADAKIRNFKLVSWGLCYNFILIKNKYI